MSDAAWQDAAAQIAAHELGHEAQAALMVLDEAKAAHQGPRPRRGPRAARRLQRALERLQQDAEQLVVGPHGDLEQVQRRPTNIARLVRTVVSTHPSGRHAIDVDCAEVLLNVDPVKVERIIDNLISNALQLTPSECPVRIRLSAVPDGALFSVEDEGPGLPDDLSAVIASGTTDRAMFDGAVGLWLVVQFTHLHGGRVSVSPVDGEMGARFKIWLPAH